MVGQLIALERHVGQSAQMADRYACQLCFTGEDKFFDFSTSLSQETNICYSANRPNRVFNRLQASRARISVNAYGVMLRYARFANFNPSVRALCPKRWQQE